MSSNDTRAPCDFITSGFNTTLSDDPCSIGVFAGAGAILLLVILLVSVALICCCMQVRKRRRKRRAHDKETNENIRLTTFRSNNDGNEDGIRKSEDSNSKLEHKSVNYTNDGNKSSSAKGKKQAHERVTTDKKEKTKEQRRASEGTNARKNIPLTYKAAAQDKKNDKEKADMMRSMSVSATVSTKDSSTKKSLPVLPSGGKAGDKPGAKKDKGSDGEITHKYANVELGAEASGQNSVEILEPKYDQVDTEGSKKNRKQSNKEQVKLKHKDTEEDDHEHFYHTLEESEKVGGGGGTYDEEYDSPKSKGLVVTRNAVTDRKGKPHAMSTDENATVKETRAKSYSGKKSSKKGKKKDPEYDQPTHNTLPHKASATKENEKKDTLIQAGKLASIFDDPMYVASQDVTTSTQSATVKDAAKSADSPAVLRNPEQPNKAKDDPEYDQPNENKGKLKKEALYSSRLFDDPKYEGGLP